MKCYDWKVRFISRTGPTMNLLKRAVQYSTHTDTMKAKPDGTLNEQSPSCDIYIENRIYREELKESLGMNLISPFQPEREFKVYKSCKCSQIICSRVHSYSMFPRPFISISNFLNC